MTNEQGENKKESLIGVYGSQIVDMCIEDSIIQSESQESSINLLRVVVETSPKTAFKKIKILTHVLVRLKYF